MSLFHTHFYNPSEKDPEILWCYCGATKDLHRHVWEFYNRITGERDTAIGDTLKCKVCGDLKNHYASD